MTQKSIATLARVIIILFAVLGAAFFGAAIPLFGADTVQQNPEFSGWFVPWLIFLEPIAVPCYAALVFAWRIASTIARGEAFRAKNARRFKIISLLALGTSVYFFVGNVVLIFAGMHHPGVFLISFVLVFIGVSISAAAAILSYMVRKAAVLQEESDWTI